MHYHLRAQADGRVILSRSSLRYLFSLLFLAVAAGSGFMAYAIGRGQASLPYVDFLSACALCLIFASASFIVLMNQGSPAKIVLDGDGILLVHPGKSLRIWKESVSGVNAVQTMALPEELDGKKRLATKKIQIELAIGTAIPVYEGPNEPKISKYVARCREALESGPSKRDTGRAARLDAKLYETRLLARGIVKRDGGNTVIRVPVKLDLPGFLMGMGIEAGIGIFLFGSLPGRIEGTVMAISVVIWGLVAISLVVAAVFALFGKQKLVIGPREIESRRRFLGIPFPPRSLSRAEAAAVSLDLEVGQLSVISKELKRILSEAQKKGAMGEKMGELLGGKAVKMNLSALSWSERIAVQMAVSASLSEPIPPVN